MASEPRRACGYRKVGGLYLCSDGLGAGCCKLPILLHVCPTCNGGVKQTRGWQWIDPRPWLKGECSEMPPRKSPEWVGNPNYVAFDACPAATPERLGEKVGLLWVGEQFYPTPSSFAVEAASMGVSRRIIAMPRGFKVGESWVFLAHQKIKEVGRCRDGRRNLAWAAYSASSSRTGSRRS